MSTLRYFDVHTHTQFAAFKEDQDAVVKRALDAGIWMVNVGTQRDTSAAAIRTAEQYADGVYAAVGLHPIHTEKSYHDPQELGAPENPQVPHFIKRGLGGFTSRGEDFDYDYYKNLAQHPKVVAIGECGLDYYRIRNREAGSTEEAGIKEKQCAIFKQHIQLTAAVQKPVMIHCRNAFDDLISILRASHSALPAPYAGIIHFFTGTVDDAKKLLDMGFLFSFGGVLTFARDYDEVVRYIPLERIVLETDAPYVAPVPYRGKRNEPAYVAEVAKKIADIKKLPLDEVAGATFENAKELFDLSAAVK
ncbi:MAG: TatD family hydrolase [Patescibacteria group bacterium]